MHHHPINDLLATKAGLKQQQRQFRYDELATLQTPTGDPHG